MIKVHANKSISTVAGC